MSTSLYLNFDGANNSTVFTDSSPAGNVITTQGTAKITTSESIFGGSSGKFEKSIGCCLSMPEAECFNFSSDFTVRFRIRLSGYNPNYSMVLSPSGKGLEMLITDTGLIYMSISYDGVNQSVSSYSTIYAPLSIGVWAAISIERYQDLLLIYKDGVLLGSVAITAPIYHDASRNIVIGGKVGLDMSVIGVIDEFIVKNGEAMAVGASSYTVETMLFVTYNIALTLAESIAAVNFLAYIYRLSDGLLVSMHTVTAGVSNLEVGKKEPVLITVMPDQGGIWQPSTAYAVNDLVFPGNPITTPHYYKRIVAGTSGAVEPTWATTGNGQCNDGAVSSAWERVDGLSQPISIGPLIPA